MDERIVRISTTGDGGSFIPFATRHLIDATAFAAETILVGLNSDFGNRFGSMMIVPHSGPVTGSPVDMVLRPYHPQSYCVDRTLTYAYPATPRGISGAQTGIPTSVSLVGYNIPSVDPVNDSVSYLTLNIGRTGTSSLPQSVFNQLLRLISSFGGRLISENRISAPNCFENMVSQLPPVLFELLDVDRFQSPLLHFLFMPDEYLQRVPNDRNQCILNFVLGTRIPEHNYDIVSLDLDFLKDMVVHFDYSNSRIGFGDPL